MNPDPSHHNAQSTPLAKSMPRRLTQPIFEMPEIGRARLVMTLRDASVLATCYAEPNGRVRPRAVIRYLLACNPCSLAFTPGVNKVILPIALGIGVGIGTGTALAVALHSSILGLSLGIGIGIAMAFVFALVIRNRKTG